MVGDRRKRWVDIQVPFDLDPEDKFREPVVEALAKFQAEGVDRD